MDTLMSFAADRWYVIAGVLVALWIVVKVVKTVVKWVIVLALLAGLLYYGASYKDQLIELGTTVGAEAAAEVKTRMAAQLQNEIKEAKYEKRPDGSYVVMTKNVKLEGKPGDPDVKVMFMNQTFTVKMDDVLQALIAQAQKNGGA
ncbi:hypothetical protein [Paenibacillus sp. YYML68]|uniref:hypothetical protein n=1 Tax=Paenibacillus sp. YYML68 TaxID=2909250 RepID=UPI002490CF67|nr:hypothetical protein [Paenibacillus sp. YYML68]